MSTPRTQRFFAVCGIVAPILFTLLVVGSSLLRPGYSQTRNFISDLGVGPLAILQNANFVVFGLLVVGLALGLFSIAPGPRRLAFQAGVSLVVIFGLAVLLAGVFPEDYGGGGVHNAVSSTAFVSIIAAQLVVWRGLQGADGPVWSRFRRYSLISGILSFVLLVVFNVSLGGEFQGAAQRAFLAVPWTWIEIAGFKFLSVAKGMGTLGT